MNLTKVGLWALGTVELPKLMIDELTAEFDVKSSKYDKEDHEKGAPEIIQPKRFTKSMKTQRKLLHLVLRTATIKKRTSQPIAYNQR